MCCWKLVLLSPYPCDWWVSLHVSARHAHCELGARASVLCCHRCCVAGCNACIRRVCAPRPRAASSERAARAQDVDEGYNDEMAGHGKEKREREPMMPPTGLPAHFSMAGTAEHAIVRPLLMGKVLTHVVWSCPGSGPRMTS